VVINEISLNHGITKNRISKAYSKGKILQNVRILNPSITNLFTDLTIEVAEPLFFDENVIKELDSKIEIPISQSISLKDVFERIFNPEKYFQPGELLVTIGNPKIAEINQKFVLKAKNNGSTYLKINDMYGKILGSIEIIVPYSIGDIGPAGGLIFYDDILGFDINSNGEIGFNEKDLLDGVHDGIVTGKRFLEAAPYGWYNDGDDPYIRWSKIVRGRYTETVRSVGKGQDNTDRIIQVLGADAYAAKACSDYSNQIDGIVYNDWFLPSSDELTLMERNLFNYNRGGLSSKTYWSSTEASEYYVSTNDIGSEMTFADSGRKDFSNQLRPIRAFSIIPSILESTSVGELFIPKSDLIVHIEDSTGQNRYSAEAPAGSDILLRLEPDLYTVAFKQPNDPYFSETERIKIEVGKRITLDPGIVEFSVMYRQELKLEEKSEFERRLKNLPLIQTASYGLLGLGAVGVIGSVVSYLLYADAVERYNSAILTEDIIAYRQKADQWSRLFSVGIGLGVGGGSLGGYLLATNPSRKFNLEKELNEIDRQIQELNEEATAREARETQDTITEVFGE